MSSFMDFSFEYLLDLLGSGPGTTHMMLWEVLLGDSHFGFKEYYQVRSMGYVTKIIISYINHTISQTALL